MEQSEIDQMVLQEIYKTHFVGFALEDIEAGLKTLADAVKSKSGKDVTSNGTSKRLEESFKDPRPFVIQNHGSLEKAYKVWNNE